MRVAALSIVPFPVRRWLALGLGLVLALGLGTGGVGAADLAFSSALGEELAANGILDVGETVTVSLQATYAPGEGAVNYQVDLVLAGSPGSFTATAVPPPAFGSPGDAVCAVVASDRLRCFGNVDLLADSTARVTSAANPVPLGSFQLLATAGGSPLQVAPAISFSEQLVSDPQNPALLTGSPLPLTLTGLDASGNVLDVTTGAAPADSDGDGIPDDGNLSGVAGDAPCTPGQTLGCDDNCAHTPNPLQSDSGGQNTATADGIGDACQCGDVSGDGVVNVTDSVVLKRFLGGLPPGVDVAKCSVTGATECDVTDSVVLERFLGGLGPGLSQVCTAAVP
ncbi:MAG: hypothetical protein ACE5IL_12840 [Myxococcota bacterium]